MQIRLDDNVISHAATLFDFGHIGFVVHIASCMQHLYLRSAGKCQLGLQHSVVDGACTATAAADKNRLLFGVQPQLFNSLLARMLQYFTADRVASIFQLCLAMEIFAACLIAQKYLAYIA